MDEGQAIRQGGEVRSVVRAEVTAKGGRKCLSQTTSEANEAMSGANSLNGQSSKEAMMAAGRTWKCSRKDLRLAGMVHK